MQIVSQALEAKAALLDAEAALDACDWPWSRRLSLWRDALVVLAELGR